VEQTEQRLAQRRSGSPRDTDLDLPRTTLPIERIDGSVAAHFGVRPEDLASCATCGGRAKFVAVELACRLTGMTQRAIAAHYGEITSAAVSNIRRRIRRGQYECCDVVETLHRAIRSVSS